MMRTNMRFIGITGGVGAGKSAILAYLTNKPKTKVMLADEIAHQLMEPGSDCYRQIVTKFQGEDIFDKEGAFDKGKLAQIIFSNPQKREAMNAIVHPAVKDFVRKQYKEELEKEQLNLLVLEAALLIEEEYDEICDELWYIYTSEENRRKRLVESRGYSQEKINNIFKSQLSEEEFRKGTQVTIDNNGDLENTFQQIEIALRRKADE